MCSFLPIFHGRSTSLLSSVPNYQNISRGSNPRLEVTRLEVVKVKQTKVKRGVGNWWCFGKYKFHSFFIIVIVFGSFSITSTTKSSYFTYMLVMTSRWFLLIFGVSRSKFKVKVTLDVKMVSAYYLEYYIPQSFHISYVDWSSIVDDHYWFWGQ